MRKSWQKSPNNYAEAATEVVRVVVAAHRQNGTKTVAALEISAPEMETRPRRLRQLFERDRTPFVGSDEIDRMLLRGASVLRGIASRLRETADRWDAEADWMEKRRQDLRGNGECGNSTCGELPQRRAA